MIPVQFIEDITIEIIYDNDAPKEIVLPVPDRFEIDFSKMYVRNKYRDIAMKLQAGRPLFKVVVKYGYDQQDIETNLLLTAKRINLKFPPDIDELQEFEARLLNSDSVKDYYNRLVIGGDGNPIPGGSLDLEFEIVNSFTWEEILELKWFMGS